MDNESFVPQALMLILKRGEYYMYDPGVQSIVSKSVHAAVVRIAQISPVYYYYKNSQFSEGVDM